MPVNPAPQVALGVRVDDEARDAVEDVGDEDDWDTKVRIRCVSVA